MNGENQIYNWSSDLSSVTASISSNYEEVIREDGKVTVNENPKATCSEDGKKVAVASFNNPKFTNQNKEMTIESLGHEWNTPTYVWNGLDSVTAQRICKRDANHIEKETAKVIVTEEKATCEKEGKKIYRVAFANTAFTPQVKEVKIDALEHNFETTVVEPTTTKEGYTLHKCVNCGAEYKTDKKPKITKTDEKSKAVDVTKLEHNYVISTVDPTYDHEGYTLHKCTICGNEFKTNIIPKRTRTKIQAEPVFYPTNSKAKEYQLEVSNNKGQTMTYVSSDPKNVTVSPTGKITVKKKFIGTATITITTSDNTTKTVVVSVGPNPSRVTSAKNKKKLKIAIKVKKAKNAKKYQIKIEGDGYTKSYTMKGTSKTVKVPQKGTYSVSVRTFNKGVYSDWSSSKKVVVKK